MSDLLDMAIDAHGGLELWRGLKRITVDKTIGGPQRAEERRGGKEWVRRGRSGWETAYDVRISDLSSDVCSSDLDNHNPKDGNGQNMTGRCGGSRPATVLDNL